MITRNLPCLHGPIKYDDLEIESDVGLNQLSDRDFEEFVLC